AVFVGEDLLVPAGPEIRGQGQERAAVGQVSGDEHDRALLRAARSASLRAAETERVEQGGSRQRKQLAPDDPRRGLLRDGKVLERCPGGPGIQGRASHSRSGSTAVSR